MTELCNEPLLKPSGKFCESPAIATVEGYHKKVCGTHKRTVEKKLASGQAIDKNLKTKILGKNPDENVPTTTTKKPLVPKKTAESISTGSLSEFANEILFEGTTTQVKKIRTQPILIINTIREAIKDDNQELISLTDQDKQIIETIPTTEKSFEIIMANAYKNSSSTDKKIDYCSIARQIGPSYFGYQKAVSIEHKPMKTEISFFKRRQNVEKDILSYEIESDKELPYKKIDFGGSGMLQINYPDVNIKICNCKFVDMDEWLKDEKNIYMGPSFGFHFMEDTKWFIPFNPKEFLNREEQNNYDIKNIMKKIEKGEMDKEMFLSLQNKVLGCVCMPNFCHCEVYVGITKILLSQ